MAVPIRDFARVNDELVQSSKKDCLPRWLSLAFCRRLDNCIVLYLGSSYQIVCFISTIWLSFTSFTH